MRQSVKLLVNGLERVVDVDTTWSLAYVLRNNLGLTGTKIACDVGACGSCTVILDGQAVNSCLMLAVQAEGKGITTIEGLAVDGKLHPLQQAFIDGHALQCGYCTPGVLMAAKAFLDRNPHPSQEEVREAVGGHICRCGSYHNIVEAVLQAAGERG
ncbi:MAG: (2Fe-2S)-binding protein [Dehalococcoidia bacterium]|nr:(2Fe-2S)-binding protein [Dehalococcoidia bacterium]